MTCITYFSPAPKECQLPDELTNPLSNEPHPLAKMASEQLQDLLSSYFVQQHDFFKPDGGKMFGVLVVQDGNGRVGFISAFTGMIAGQWVLPGFVPPVFNVMAREAVISVDKAQIAEYTQQINVVENSVEYQKLKMQLTQLVIQRDKELLALKNMHNARKKIRHEKRSALRQNRKPIKDNVTYNKALSGLSFESQQDKRKRQQLSTLWQTKIASIEQKLHAITQQVAFLEKARSDKSCDLRNKIFASYKLTNVIGETQQITGLFLNEHPPEGAGDCAATKLIQYGHKHHLKPLALANFWWGAPPSNAVRHHTHYYPVCRGKCHPILTFMLKGLKVQQRPLPGDNFTDSNAPHIVYEDQALLVVNKPCGLLSVPGKNVKDSVLTRLQQRYPEATGPLLVHRLDLATSGLLLVAKNSETHKALQQQFLNRSIAKRYVAVLSKVLGADTNRNSIVTRGRIELPMCVDLNDRPRQIVCFNQGKPAETLWEVIESGKDSTRVYFYPITGRTHQLRVHAAHKDGLNAPIVGDKLYGVSAERLLLHAERLSFSHPVTGKWTVVETPAPF